MLNLQEIYAKSALEPYIKPYGMLCPRLTTIDIIKANTGVIKSLLHNDWNNLDPALKQRIDVFNTA